MRVFLLCFILTACGGLSSELQKVEIRTQEIDDVMQAVQRVLAQSDLDGNNVITGNEVYFLVNGIIFELISRFAPTQEEADAS